MQQKYFSIIIVSLNPGERLKTTLDSIFSQVFLDYEIILKDGGSTDGALLSLQNENYFLDKSVQIIDKKDAGIYDAMNQALEYATGKYIQFLNCGDSFKDSDVLQKVYESIENNQMNPEDKHIFYGDQYNLIQNCMITSVPEINDFACYRNVPCHQVCFYDKRLFEKRAYKPEYTVRADYEHFLYCIYEERAKTEHIPITICYYEGGGYSETKENRKHSNYQHKEITKKYLGKKALRYRMIMLLTLAPLRSRIAQSKTLSKYYNKLKSFFYK